MACSNGVHLMTWNDSTVSPDGPPPRNRCDCGAVPMTHTPAAPDPSAEPTAAAEMSKVHVIEMTPEMLADVRRVVRTDGGGLYSPTGVVRGLLVLVDALRAEVSRLAGERDTEEEKHAACHDELIEVEHERDALRAELGAAREVLAARGPEPGWVGRLTDRDGVIMPPEVAQAQPAADTPASALPTHCERCGEEIGNAHPLGSLCLSCDVEQQRQRWAASAGDGGQGGQA